MGIRETVNENPAAVTFATILIIAVVATTMLWQTRPDPMQRHSDELPRAFFSADDGTSWYPDDARKIPPFTRAGQTVVGCQVFVPAGDNASPFVGYLERYRPEARERLQRLLDAKEPPDSKAFIAARQAGREVKLPHAPADSWLLASDPAGIELVDGVLHRQDSMGRGVERAIP